MHERWAEEQERSMGSSILTFFHLLPECSTFSCPWYERSRATQHMTFFAETSKVVRVLLGKLLFLLALSRSTFFVVLVGAPFCLLFHVIDDYKTC